MAGSLAEIRGKDFDKAIAAGVVLVDFWAPWCGPCRMQAPILEKVAKTIGDKAKIVKLNVDEEGEIAGRYNIQSIPTMILFKDGVEMDRLIGLRQEKELLSAIESVIGS